MAEMERESVDAVVCDPPYGLEFMGKAWDHGVPGEPFWVEAWRLAKPGAHLVAFGGTRTYHRLACGIEDAGWELRDCLSWLYGSGFPKSHNGPWGGTALKPAWEPIILARKPLVGTVAANVEAFRVGSLNIDGCRIAVEDSDYARNCSGDRGHAGTRTLEERRATDLRPGGGCAGSGRWPANVALDQDAAEQLDLEVGELVSGANPTRRGSSKFRNTYGEFAGQESCTPHRGVDRGGPSRFFYCAKASRAERERGLDGRERKAKNWSSGEQNPGSFQAPGTDRSSTNHHPTVKPVALMRWLCRLVTPSGGLVLDPFCGSGTTGVAAVLEGFRFHGIEQVAEYVELAEGRIAHAQQYPHEWMAA